MVTQLPIRSRLTARRVFERDYCIRLTNKLKKYPLFIPFLIMFGTNFITTFVMFREGDNFGQYLKISSLSYNVEYWVWNPKQHSLAFYIYSAYAHVSQLIVLQTSDCPIYISTSVRQWSRRPGFNPRSRHTRDFKNGTWYLLA